MNLRKFSNWSERLTVIKQRKTNNWTLDDLDKVIKGLKKNQSIDPNGMLNETFLPNVMGIDLKSGLLSLMNGVKSEMVIPYNLQLANISSIFKNKGSRLELLNDRGIFILPVVRKVLDKLLYLDKYPSIESAMSDSNIGSRKNKNIKNHLLIVYGVINSALKEGNICLDILIYDLIQAFDGWMM